MDRSTVPSFLLNRIDPLMQLEPLFLIIGFALCSWVASKIFLRKVSSERIQFLNELFKNLTIHILVGLGLFIIYSVFFTLSQHHVSFERIMIYLGFLTILEGSIIFVKILRALLFQYLFLSYRNVAFPLLLVNLFTLMMSLLLASWIGTEIFNIKLAPLLATSAIFSLVLGLALQDTLGNLFAGVSIQVDKPYHLGDWIEIQQSGQKLVGQVYDITWRATLLLSCTEELITVPNRTVAQAQILNFSSKFRPIVRSQIFRVGFDVDVSNLKMILPTAIRSIPSVKRNPAPYVAISEITDQWIALKLVYYIDNFGEQSKTTDQVLTRCLGVFKEHHIDFAPPRVFVQLAQTAQAAQFVKE
jgi:small-conductance mechanosensitive channel